MKPPKRSSPLRQWGILLYKRYLELLKNSRVDLDILCSKLLLIALRVICLIKPILGKGDSTPIRLCNAQARTNIYGEGTSQFTHPYFPAVSKDCNRLEDILKTTVQGQPTPIVVKEWIRRYKTSSSLVLVTHT